jgi:hypothetical protein
MRLNEVRSRGRVAFAFLSNTIVLRVTSSAFAAAATVVHGVSVAWICLYGT